MKEEKTTPSPSPNQDPSPSPLQALTPDQTQRILNKLDLIMELLTPKPGRVQSQILDKIKPGPRFTTNARIRQLLGPSLGSDNLSRTLVSLGFKKDIRKRYGATVRGFYTDAFCLVPGTEPMSLDDIQSMEPDLTREELLKRGFYEDADGRFLCKFLTD